MNAKPNEQFYNFICEQYTNMATVDSFLKDKMLLVSTIYYISTNKQTQNSPYSFCHIIE